MPQFRAPALLSATLAVAACSPGDTTPPRDTPTAEPTPVRVTIASERRPSAPARLGQQELAIRIGPRCAEPTHVAYPPATRGGGDYVVTCGADRFRVVVAADGSTEVQPMPR